MPPYKCHVEISPQEQFPDPTSINRTREMRNFAAGKSEQYSDLRYATLITFTLEASDLETAKAQVDAMCDEFLVNKVYEQATVTVTDTEDLSA